MGLSMLVETFIRVTEFFELSKRNFNKIHILRENSKKFEITKKKKKNFNEISKILILRDLDEFFSNFLHAQRLLGIYGNQNFDWEESPTLNDRNLKLACLQVN